VPSGSDDDPPFQHLTYAQPADVPINESGEVEEEAISWSEAGKAAN
jgi:hypothetical protein